MPEFLAVDKDSDRIISCEAVRNNPSKHDPNSCAVIGYRAKSLVSCTEAMTGKLSTIQISCRLHPAAHGPRVKGDSCFILTVYRAS